MMTAADTYAAMIDAVNAQQSPLRRRQREGDRWAGRTAERFRADPRRELDQNLAMIASYVEPEDVLVDVGGGAGRLGLPLALRCRELINVDPSDGMRGQFEALVREAGITNARFVPAAWPLEDGITGDVLLTAHVTYFVRDIAPFVAALQRAARRRVLIVVRSVPPPMAQAATFAAVYGEPQSPVPSYRELLPVLWELGILPELRLLPVPARAATGWPAATREDAIALALDRIGVPGDAQAGAVVERRFDELFEEDSAGIWPRQPLQRELLITWEP
jgi:hypothetical protein